MSHLLSNATKWGLLLYEFGLMLRLSHVLQAKGIPSAAMLFRRCCAADEDSLHGESYVVNEERSAFGKEIWEVFTRYILSHKGPYWETKSDKLATKIVRIS